MQNTLVNVTPDATTDRAPINAAGEVISETFFAPVETDLIDGLLGRYNFLRAKLNDLSVSIRGGENHEAVGHFLRGNLHGSRGYHVPPVSKLFDLPGALASLNADFWQQALSLTDVYEYMPNDRRNDWNNQIHEMKAPDFEENAVRATLTELLFSRQKFFSERVDGIFRSLSRSHVTNRPEGFSKRMIIECMFDQWGHCNYDRTGYVDDLRKVIAKFMGRDATGLNTTNKILNIARARSGEWVAIDGGALRVKAFLKGTIHLEIHPDMAWRLNDILAFLHPAAIPAEHRQKPRTKAKTFELHTNLLPFSVLSVLSDLETERTEPLQRNRREEPHAPVTTNPFNRRFKGYSDENKGDEEPSPDAVFRSVRYSLKQLGMEEHQYVAAIHRDTDNIHCHVSANRVHPITFRAQNMWNDADELQKCCRVLERELGFKVDNGSWHMDEYGDLHRTRRDMPSTPRGAAKREIFSDKESLHGYAVRETRQMLSDFAEQDCLDWPLVHNVLYTRGLGLREQQGGLAVYDLMNPYGVSVKASDVHPAISYKAMVKRWGDYQPAPPASDPDNHEAGILVVDKFYMPQLHVRDQEARRERREARAIARDILRARYDAYRSGWEKTDLRAGERFRQIASHCVVAKAHVRDSVRDPLMRKLMYRVAEFEKMKAMAELRLQLREERQTLKETGDNRPLSWKSWVEREASRGDVAALSQMRGWAYRDKRAARQQKNAWPEPNAIVHYGAGDNAPAIKSSEHETRLLRDGTVSYLRDDKPAVTDFGDRVEVYPAPDTISDRFNNDLAAELTARRSGDNTVLSGEAKAVILSLPDACPSYHPVIFDDRFTCRERAVYLNVQPLATFRGTRSAIAAASC